jgi:hypothetical protein
MAQLPWLSLSPCWFPFVPPFMSPSTYLAPSSCDRNRPPPSQVACKLTPFAPPFTQLTHPLQIPRTPTAPRLTMTTSGIFRLLLSGTLMLLHSDVSWVPMLSGPNVPRSWCYSRPDFALFLILPKVPFVFSLKTYRIFCSSCPYIAVYIQLAIKAEQQKRWSDAMKH